MISLTRQRVDGTFFAAPVRPDNTPAAARTSFAGVDGSGTAEFATVLERLLAVWPKMYLLHALIGRLIQPSLLLITKVTIEPTQKIDQHPVQVRPVTVRIELGSVGKV